MFGLAVRKDGLNNVIQYSERDTAFRYQRKAVGEIIKDLVIPNDVNTISAYCFTGCSELNSLTIPHNTLQALVKTHLPIVQDLANYQLISSQMKIHHYFEDFN